MYNHTCCGWIEVTDFDTYTSNDVRRLESDLKIITDPEGWILPTSSWSYRKYADTRFAVVCTLTEEQCNKHEERLTSLGFKKTSTFRNPNTNSILSMFIFIPKECHESSEPFEETYEEDEDDEYEDDIDY